MAATVQAVATANRSAIAVHQAADLVAATLQAVVPVVATIEREFAQFACVLCEFVEYAALQAAAAMEAKLLEAAVMVATVHSESAVVQVAATTAKSSFGQSVRLNHFSDLRLQNSAEKSLQPHLYGRLLRLSTNLQKQPVIMFSSLVAFLMRRNFIVFARRLRH